jgi:hypothetical protein
MFADGLIHPTTKPSLFYNDPKYKSTYTKFSMKSFTTDLLSYWQQRFHWSKAQVHSIDLLVGTQTASKKILPDMARQIQKLRCGWLPVNNVTHGATRIGLVGGQHARLPTWYRKRWTTSFSAPRGQDEGLSQRDSPLCLSTFEV